MGDLVFFPRDLTRGKEAILQDCTNHRYFSNGQNENKREESNIL